MNRKLNVKVILCTFFIILGILSGGYLGRFFIAPSISVFNDSRSQNLKELLVKDPNPTFLPNIKDRVFWDQVINKPERFSKEAVLLRIEGLHPPQQLDILTEQLLFYPDSKELVLLIEGVINKYIDDNSLAEFSQNTFDEHNAHSGISSSKKPLNVGLHLLAFSASLANSVSLLEGIISPEVVSRAHQWLTYTVIDSFLKDYQRYQTQGAGSGESRSPWLQDPDSPAIPPCLSNLVYIALSIPIDPNKKAQVVEISCGLMRDYFAARAAQGVSYPGGIWAWSNGFYYYLVMIERLIQATQGELNLYEDPLVQSLVQYPFESGLALDSNGLSSPTYMVFGFNQNPPQALSSSMALLKRRFEFTNFTGVASPKIMDGLRFSSDIYYSPFSVDLPKKKINYPSMVTIYGVSGEVIVRDPDYNLLFAASDNRAPIWGIFDYSGSYSLFGSCNGVWSVYLGDTGVPPPPPRNLPVVFLLERPLPIVNSTMQSMPRGLTESDPFNFNNQSLSVNLTPYYDVEGLNSVSRVISYEKGCLIVKDHFEALYPVSFETIIPTSLAISRTMGSFDMGLCGDDFELIVEASGPYTVRARDSSKGLGQQLISIALTERKPVGYIKYIFKKKDKS